MKKGDIVVVPLPYGEFSVYEVIEEAHPITELEKEEKEIVPKWNNKILWEEGADKNGKKGKFLKDQEEIS